MPISASAAPNRAPISRGACSDRAAPELRGRRQRHRGCLPRRRSLTDAGHSPAGRAPSDARELSLRLARKRPSSRAVRSPLRRAAGSKGSRAISRRRPVAVSRGIPPRPSLSLIARWRRVRSGLRGLQPGIGSHPARTPPVPIATRGIRAGIAQQALRPVAWRCRCRPRPPGAHGPQSAGSCAGSPGKAPSRARRAAGALLPPRRSGRRPRARGGPGGRPDPPPAGQPLREREAGATPAASPMERRGRR